MEVINCSICNEHLEGHCIQSHLLKHIKCKDTTLDYKTLKAQCIINTFPELSTKEKFIELYENNSIPDFTKKFGICDIRPLCDFYGIKRKSISDRRLNNGLSIRKYKETCLEKYGADNALSRGTKPFEKRNSTVKERYGCNNVFQIPEVIDKINSNDFWLERHGCTKSEFYSLKGKEIWSKLSDDEKQRWLDASIHKNGINKQHYGSISSNGLNSSLLEKKVYGLLLESNIDFSIQKKLKRTKSKNFFYDVLLNELSILIEVNGDYWHANPDVYLADDEIKYPGGNRTARDVWEKDIEKEDLAISKGFIEIAIWESELSLVKSFEDLKQIILRKLKEVKEHGSTYFKERNLLRE